MKYIALFRGINVGGRNKLPMKELVKIFVAYKCSDVQTYIQSGNIVFEYNDINIEALIKKIQNKIKKEFNFTPDILVLTKKAFTLFIKKNPFVSKNGKDIHFYFLKEKVSKIDLKKIESVKTETEKFKFDKNIFYLFAPDGIGRSKLAASVEKTMGVPTTGRNYNTIVKLQLLLNDE